MSIDETDAYRPAPGGRRLSARSLLLRRPARRIVVLTVLASVIVGIGIGSLAIRRKAVYESETALLADQPALVFQSRDEGVIRKLSLLRLKYRDLITTSLITRPVARNLGIPEARVQAGASAILTPQSLLLKIIGKAGTAPGAARLANQVAIEVAAYADREQATQGVGEKERFVFRRVGGATPGRKILPKASRGYAAGVASALIVFAGGFFLAQVVAARRSA